MGQAKRRKQNDPTYGKVPFLGTKTEKRKHLEKMVDDLYSEFDSELKTLSIFEKVPDEEYKQIFTSLDKWINNRLLNYREQDREILANSLAAFMYSVLEEHDLSHLLCICFVDILKPWMFPELVEELLEVLKKDTVETGSA